jgi:hypothetical protein
MIGEAAGPQPTTSVRVLLLAGGTGEKLAAALGPQRAQAVRALLLERARTWAQTGFSGATVELVEQSSFAAALAADAMPADPLPARPAAARPVVMIAPELAVWLPELATSVLADLGAGCALSLAPIFDRGLYLLSLADPSPELAATLAALDLAGPGGMAELMALAAREEWQVGLLRAERGLRQERDVRALLADPLTDPELRGLLG